MAMCFILNGNKANIFIINGNTQIVLTHILANDGF